MGGHVDFDDMPDAFDDSPLDRALARLAARQHGVVALRHLLALGLSASAVRSRVASGRLHRLHRGVYMVGHIVLSAEGRWTGAVLACGSGAVLSHRSAAALWGLRPSARALIDVTAPCRVRRPGIDAHSAGSLRPCDVTHCRGIPCTTVARTLLDLAGVIDRGGLERACDQADVLRLLDRRALDDVLARAAGRRGAPILSQVLADREPGRVTRSELESRFLALCAAAGLPRPRANARVAFEGPTIEVDFLWPEQGLIAEVDGYRFHATRRGFEQDRSRDRRLLIAGYRVVRFTWRQLMEDPDEVVATIRALLHPAPQPT